MATRHIDSRWLRAKASILFELKTFHTQVWNQCKNPSRPYAEAPIFETAYRKYTVHEKTQDIKQSLKMTMKLANTLYPINPHWNSFSSR